MTLNEGAYRRPPYSSQRTKTKRKRRLRRPEKPMPALINDFVVMTRKQWRALANISERAERRLYADGKGPARTWLTDTKWGVTFGNHKDWLASRTKTS
jgi:hypothetical protein